MDSRVRRLRSLLVHPVNGEVPPVKGRPWKLTHYANRGKTSSSGGELASARSCFSTVRTALGKLRITGLLARFDVARSFPQFPRPLLLQPTIWTSERGADLGSGRCQPRPHLPIYRMTLFVVIGDSHPESRLVRVFENVMSTSRVMNEKASTLQRSENSPWLQRGQAWGHPVPKAILISSLTGSSGSFLSSGMGCPSFCRLSM